MRVVSINVGLPRKVRWKKRVVSTSIFKEPVSGPVRLLDDNLEGDKQADLRVHGGPTKVVYAYPSEHYVFWREELPEMEFPWGAFGENLTTEGLDEESLHIGDVLRLGSATLIVTEPRMPCFKLGIRFGREDMVKRFLEAQRTGFYFGVEQTGTVEEGDRFELLSEDAQGLKVADVTRLYTTAKNDTALLTKAVETDSLPASWREHFERRLDKVG